MAMHPLKEQTMNKTVIDPKEVRRSLKLNQQEFWSRVGVTQSGGSRYENGRRMPKPVQELLRVVHVEQIDLSRVNREEVDLLTYLKSHEPRLYQSLRLQSVAKSQKPATLDCTAKQPDPHFERSAIRVAQPLLDELEEDEFKDAEIELSDFDLVTESHSSNERNPVRDYRLGYQAKRQR